MDEDLKDAIATGVTAALQKAAGGKGLKDAELLAKVDECESVAQLRAVLGQMKRDGKVTQNTTTGRWALTITGATGQAPGKLETPASETNQPRAEAKEPIGETKRAPCAAAIIAALTELPQGLRIAEMEQHPLLKGKFNKALIAYHTRVLVDAGMVLKAANRLDPYTLAGSAPIAPRAAAADKAPRKKKAARGAQPKTARLTAAAERKAQASEPPAKPAPTPHGGISITMRCPAGDLTLSGTHTLVFGFLDQLKALAA